MPIKSAQEVLVVNADPLAAGWIVDILRPSSFRVSVAGSLEEALTRLSANPRFVAIVCEYHLPDGTCLELLAWLRAEQRARLPVLVTSGSWSRSFSAGTALEFLASPVTGPGLLAALARLVHPGQPAADATARL